MKLYFVYATKKHISKDKSNRMTEKSWKCQKSHDLD